MELVILVYFTATADVLHTVVTKVFQDGGRLLISSRAFTSSSIVIPCVYNWERVLLTIAASGGIRSETFAAVSHRTSRAGYGSSGGHPETTVSEGVKGTTMVILHFVGFLNSAINGGRQQGVEPRSPAAGTWAIPISRSRASLEGKGKGLRAGGAVHVVFAIRTFQRGVCRTLCIVSSTDAHNNNVRVQPVGTEECTSGSSG
jgi:hypothetical protein